MRKLIDSRVEAIKGVNMENIAQRIHEIMMDSMFKPEEIKDPKTPPDGAVLIEGIMSKFGFHPTRLESHRDEIKTILNEMPQQFHKKTGGGWSFLNLCMDKNENQWGEHRDIDSLVCLAKGLNLGGYQMPREMWNILPGGMPYVMFDVES